MVTAALTLCSAGVFLSSALQWRSQRSQPWASLWGSVQRVTQQKRRQHLNQTPGGGGGGPDCNSDVFFPITAQMHPIRVAERLGVRLPASPPPTSPRNCWPSRGTTGTRRPDGRSPKNAAKCCEKPDSVRHDLVDERIRGTPGRRCMISGTSTTRPCTLCNLNGMLHSYTL